MKMFRRIRDKGQLRAICAALNKLLWKTPRGGKSANEQAEYWRGELRDRDIDIAWNRKQQRFQLGRANDRITRRATDRGGKH
jgi:hypothetical protein